QQAVVWREGHCCWVVPLDRPGHNYLVFDPHDPLPCRDGQGGAFVRETEKRIIRYLLDRENLDVLERPGCETKSPAEIGCDPEQGFAVWGKIGRLPGMGCRIQNAAFSRRKVPETERSIAARRGEQCPIG